jgi:hypothetical protein
MNRFGKSCPNFLKQNWGFLEIAKWVTLSLLAANDTGVRSVKDFDQIWRYQNVIIIFFAHFFMLSKAKIDFGEV